MPNDLSHHNLGDMLRRERQASVAVSAGIELERPAPLDVKKEILLSDELKTAIKGGWAPTWSFLFDTPRRPLVARLASHHRKTIRWHWAARHRLCRHELAKQQLEIQLGNGDIDETTWRLLVAAAEIRHNLEYYADFPTWSRGHMKSTIAKRVAVIDAVVSLYYGVPGYCLYVSGTDGKTEKHALSIGQLLKSAVIQKHAPLLAQVKRDEEGGKSLGWKATFFYTAANYVFHFGSLQQGLAGGNVDDIRPTLIVLDDIDDRKDSIVQSESNFTKLTTEILPMGMVGTLTLWAQNLVSRYASRYKIHKGQARVLTNRTPASQKLIPAVIGLKTEPRKVKGGQVQDVIIAGEPTWPFFGLKQCQDELNRMGLPAFLRECQHEVEQSTEGLMFNKYDDAVHVISYSEFSAVFGSLNARKSWNKWLFNDWARTKTKFHANVAGELCVSSKNAPFGYGGMTFLFNPMSFPPNSTPEDVAERMLSNYAVDVEMKDGTRKTWAQLRSDTLRRVDVAMHTKTVREKIEFERAVLADIVPQYARKVFKDWNVLGGAMSHSEDTVREIYRKVFALSLSPSNPEKFDSIDDINRAMMVDYNEPHPFRPFQLGYTRWFIVVPDNPNPDQRDEPTEPRIDRRGRRIVLPEPYPDALKPDDLHDHALVRYQFCNWRRAEAKLTITGEKVDDVIKTDDDFGQGIQMVYHKKLMKNAELPAADQVEEHMPSGLTEDALDAIEDPGQRANALQARLQKLKELDKTVGANKPKPQHPGIRRLRRK